MSEHQENSTARHEPSREGLGAARAVILIISSIISVGLSIAWALTPLTPQLGLREGATQEARLGTTDTHIAALDLTGFNAPLWLAPPPPPSPPPSSIKPPMAATPPPLKWQLIAIECDGAAYRAILYDPDVIQLLVAKEGERIGARQITRITARTIDVREGALVRRLVLAEDDPGDDR